MRKAILAAALLIPALAHADMYQDGSNAAVKSLGNISTASGGGIYPAKGYGSCTWEASNDVGACINAAVADTTAKGGGTVIVPAGTYGLTQTVNLADKVRVEGAGAANFGQCGTTLKWLGAAAGTMVAAGSDAAQVMAGTGFSGACLDGNGLAGTGIKWRSVNYGIFSRLYIYGVTANGWDIDISAAVSAKGNMFNVVEDAYTDLLGAPSLNANGMLIGPGTTVNTNRNIFRNFTVTYQNGKGIICGNADSNVWDPAHIESVSATPGPSVDMLGSAVDVFRPCRSNRFAGEFGTTNIAASHPVARAGTYPSRNNWLFQNHESGAPPPLIEAGATLAWSNNQGLMDVARIGLGGNPVGGTGTMSLYGSTSGTITVQPPAVAGTNTLTLPAATGTLLTETASAWQPYTPAVSCGVGAATLGTIVGQYKQYGKTVLMQVQVPITTAGTCDGQLAIDLPVFPAAAVGEYSLHGRVGVGAFSGAAVFGIINAVIGNTNRVLVYKYDGTTVAASGVAVNVGGTYQVP